MATARRPYSKSPDSLNKAAAVLPQRGFPSCLEDKERLANIRRSPEPPPILRNNTREISYLLREEEKERRDQAKVAKKPRAEKKRKTPESDTASDDVSNDAASPNKKPKLTLFAEQSAGSGLEKTDSVDDLKPEPDVADSEKSTWFPVVEVTGELVLYPSLFSWMSRQSPETFSMMKKFGFCKS